MAGTGTVGLKAGSTGQGSSSLSNFQYNYQICPIILVSGGAANVPGAQTPLVNILQSTGLLSQPGTPSQDDYFAQFTVMPGGTLVDIQVATYPFANQTIAANDVITQPLHVSIRMTCPARGNVTLAGKQAIITALVPALNMHIAGGGWFNVATPAYIYQGMLLTQLRDITGDQPGAQKQIEFQWDFMQPLLTAAAAQAAQNTAMTRYSSGGPVANDPPGSNTPSNSVANPGAYIGQSVVPTLGNAISASAIPSNTGTPTSPTPGSP